MPATVLNPLPAPSRSPSQEPYELDAIIVRVTGEETEAQGG